MRRKDFACVLLETKEGKGNWANFFKEKNREFAGVEVSEAAAAELARFLEQICVTLWSLSRMARTWFLSIVDASWWYYPSKLHWVCCLVFKNPTQIVTQCWESSAVLERRQNEIIASLHLSQYLPGVPTNFRQEFSKKLKKTKNNAKDCWHSLFWRFFHSSIFFFGGLRIPLWKVIGTHEWDFLNELKPLCYLRTCASCSLSNWRGRRRWWWWCCPFFPFAMLMFYTSRVTPLEGQSKITLWNYRLEGEEGREMSRGFHSKSYFLVNITDICT